MKIYVSASCVDTPSRDYHMTPRRRRALKRVAVVSNCRRGNNADTRSKIDDEKLVDFERFSLFLSLRK